MSCRLCVMISSHVAAAFRIACFSVPEGSLPTKTRSMAKELVPAARNLCHPRVGARGAAVAGAGRSVVPVVDLIGNAGLVGVADRYHVRHFDVLRGGLGVLEYTAGHRPSAPGFLLAVGKLVGADLVRRRTHGVNVTVIVPAASSMARAGSGRVGACTVTRKVPRTEPPWLSLAVTVTVTVPGDSGVIATAVAAILTVATLPLLEDASSVSGWRVGDRQRRCARERAPRHRRPLPSHPRCCRRTSVCRCRPSFPRPSATTRRALPR